MASATNGPLYYASLLLVFFICSHLLQTLSKKYLSRSGRAGAHQHPPSPPSLPIIGHAHHLLGSASSPKKLHRLATRYGPLLQLQIGASKFILVSNADFAKEMLKTQELNFINRPDFGSSINNIYSGSGFFLAPYGMYWRFLKKLCVGRVLSTSQLNQFIHIREQEITKLLQHLIQISSENGYCDLGMPITT